MILTGLEGDYKSHQYYIYQIIKADFIYIQILVNLPQVRTLYQIQNGKPKLIAYASKRLQKAAQNYSITELELCGLAINIVSFAHLLKKVDFDAIVYTLSLTHIIKSKAVPAINRIKRLLEVLSSYSFNLYYIKSTEMILSGFFYLGRNMMKVIPIRSNQYLLICKRYYLLDLTIYINKRHLIQTTSQAKTSCTLITKVHDVDKGGDPNIKPEKQIIKPLVTPIQSHVPTESKDQCHVKLKNMPGQSRH